MTTPRLIIFDADGTLVDRDTGRWLPGVEDALSLLRRARNRPAVAIATNQGGVGCRAFGWSGNYPTEAEALARYRALAQKAGAAHLYICFAYLARDGRWSPTPPEAIETRFWQRDWRKPAPGMLLQAMSDAGVGPAETLMIGDRPEDQEAAAAAGCYFQWAQKFFARGWQEGQNYGLLR